MNFTRSILFYLRSFFHLPNFIYSLSIIFIYGGVLTYLYRKSISLADILTSVRRIQTLRIFPSFLLIKLDKWKLKYLINRSSFDTNRLIASPRGEYPAGWTNLTKTIRCYLKRCFQHLKKSDSVSRNVQSIERSSYPIFVRSGTSNTINSNVFWRSFSYWLVPYI